MEQLQLACPLTERQRRRRIIDLLAGHLARMPEGGLTVMS
jgi:hypothetical protein